MSKQMLRRNLTVYIWNNAFNIFVEVLLDLIVLFYNFSEKEKIFFCNTKIHTNT